jgi:hypothetical protein
MSTINNIIVLGDRMMIVRVSAIVVEGCVSSAGYDTVGRILLVRSLRDSLYLELIHSLPD